MRIIPFLLALCAALLCAQSAQDPLGQTLYEVRMARDEIRQLRAELRGIIDVQTRHEVEIAVNAKGLADLNAKGSDAVVALSGRVASQEVDLRKHEEEDAATRHTAERSHDVVMRWVEIFGGAILACGLGIFSAMMMHGKQLKAMRGEAKCAYNEANNVNKKLASTDERVDAEKRHGDDVDRKLVDTDARAEVEKKRNDEVDAAQTAQNCRLDKGEGRLSKGEERLDKLEK